MERIDKLLCSTGRWSRKEVKDLVRQGRVAADGRTVFKPEEKADPETVRLTVDGAEVICAPFVYVMLHKPAGCSRPRRTAPSPRCWTCSPRS